jgi:hypothetical protein
MAFLIMLTAGPSIFPILDGRRATCWDEEQVGEEGEGGAWMKGVRAYPHRLPAAALWRWWRRTRTHPAHQFLLWEAEAWVCS